MHKQTHTQVERYPDRRAPGCTASSVGAATDHGKAPCPFRQHSEVRYREGETVPNFGSRDLFKNGVTGHRERDEQEFSLLQTSSSISLLHTVTSVTGSPVHGPRRHSRPFSKRPKYRGAETQL